MYILLIAGMLMLPSAVFGQTIYFSHDAESSPISDNYAISNNRWSDAQSKVTRSSTIKKNGNYALRHEMDAQVDLQTGKVIKMLTKTPTGGLVEAYYSAWFYIEQGFDETNPDIWKNIFQFKTSNGEPTTVKGDVKWRIAPHIINNTRQLMISIADCEISDSATTIPLHHTTDYSWGGNCKFIKRSNPFVFNKNQWYHIEARYKAADPNRRGDQSVQQAGSFTIWQDGQLVMDISHPKLNTLTVFNEDPNHPNQWSNNKYMYWGIGMYGSASSQPRIQVLYTDDAMVTNYRVSSPTTSLPAPTNLAVGQ